MIEVKNISFSYDEQPVLHDISLSFHSKGLYGILGPNGVGKSTLLKLLGNILQPSQGTISFDGKNIDAIHKKKLAQWIAYVPQQVNVGYAFSVKEILDMGRHPYHERFDSLKADELELIQFAINVTGLQNLVNHRINELSSGEMQRVMIARALVQDTPIIILDEPISHLDIHYQKEIILLLQKIAHEKNKIIITVLHDMNVGLNYCDEVHLLHNKGIYSGKPNDVMTCERLEQVYRTQVFKVETDHGYFIYW